MYSTTQGWTLHNITDRLNLKRIFLLLLWSLNVTSSPHPPSRCINPLLILRKNKFELSCIFHWVITCYISTGGEDGEMFLELGLFVCLTEWEPLDGLLLLPPPFLMTFHRQLGTRSQPHHGKCAGCDTFSLPLSHGAREPHQSLTRPTSWAGWANVGENFIHFPPLPFCRDF